MSRQSRFVLLSAALLLALFFSMARPAAVYADDGAPPPPPTEEPVLPPTEEPVVSYEPSVISDQSPVVSEQSATEETVDLPEVLEQFPEDTTVVVVVDEQVEPLVTQEAADALVSADPIWCPKNATPQDGANGCSPSQTSLGNLLTWLTTNDPNQNGVIWIEKNYDHSVEAVPGFFLDGNNFTNLDTKSLTIQGGWDGLGTITVDHTQPSLFNGGNLWVQNWQADVTVNDIKITNSPIFGLYISTNGATAGEGDITLHHVTSNDNNGVGAELYNGNNNGTVGITVEQSTLNGNNANAQYDGLLAYSMGNITISQVTANDNARNGAILYNAYQDATGTITVSDSTFGESGQGNGVFVGEDLRHGLNARSNGNITLTNVTAGYNRADGAYLNNVDGTGYISVDPSSFKNNGQIGLEAHSKGLITISQVTASSNGYDGTYLNNAYVGATGTITVSDSTFGEMIGGLFYRNGVSGGGHGLKARSNGDITLSNVTAEHNVFDGAYLDNIDGTGSIFVDPSTFNDNEGTGLEAYSNGDITLANVTAGYNAYGGAYLDTGGNVEVTGGYYDYNAEDDPNNADNYGKSRGLYIDSGGSVTLSGISASNNFGDGSDIYYFSGLLVENSVFNNNHSTFDWWGWGLFADGDGDATLRNIEASGNGPGTQEWATGGAYVETNEDAAIICSQFRNNDEYGVDGSLVNVAFTLDDVTFSGNSTNYAGSPFITSGGCNPAPAGGGTGGGGGGRVQTPLYIILERTVDQLPGAVGNGNTFASALKVILTDLGAQTPGLVIPLSFPIPDDMKDDNLAVLFWNGSAWVPVPGGSVVGDFFVITVSQPGDYVLVSQ